MSVTKTGKIADEGGLTGSATTSFPFALNVRRPRNVGLTSAWDPDDEASPLSAWKMNGRYEDSCTSSSLQRCHSEPNLNPMRDDTTDVLFA